MPCCHSVCHLLTILDWKCQIQIYDHSVEDDDTQSLHLNIFRPIQDMPEANLGDVVVMRTAKVRDTALNGPLLTNVMSRCNNTI
jgi:hypothetical protein